MATLVVVGRGRTRIRDDDLQAFGNKDTTIKRLRAGASNKSDLGGVLQTNNIHIAVSAPGNHVSPVSGHTGISHVAVSDGISM